MHFNMLLHLIYFAGIPEGEKQCTTIIREDEIEHRNVLLHIFLESVPITEILCYECMMDT